MPKADILALCALWQRAASHEPLAALPDSELKPISQPAKREWRGILGLANCMQFIVKGIRALVAAVPCHVALHHQPPWLRSTEQQSAPAPT